jgi:hypothetical protein
MVSPRLAVRASIVAAVAAAIALFFVIGLRRLPPQDAALAPQPGASSPAR